MADMVALGRMIPKPTVRLLGGDRPQAHLLPSCSRAVHTFWGMALLSSRRPELLGFLALSLCFLLSRHDGLAMPQGEQSLYKSRRGGSFENVFRKKLVVFLADGLRWDYVDRAYYPGFRLMEQRGFRAGRLLPVFPSVSYPNWYSLATGLYAEDHGILGNYIYDTKTDSYFKMSAPGSFHPRWWNRAEPLWTRALRRNRTVAMFWWDGCQPFTGLMEDPAWFEWWISTT
ncbi:hypothetical protein HPB52_018366 [Rhipicephalus sanguineus]|uniref:glycerophosphocholine cholinephosphodiesterase n=1 Tax=Rhipicephalus sanguineus TaxID=34632 RepID=A0A9D4PP07_RHISA|nr:hypothetical protein HPB52_018366 [Rhipicephalus sanguineus]